MLFHIQDRLLTPPWRSVSEERFRHSPENSESSYPQNRRKRITTCPASEPSPTEAKMSATVHRGASTLDVMVLSGDSDDASSAYSLFDDQVGECSVRAATSQHLPRSPNSESMNIFTSRYERDKRIASILVRRNTAI